MTETAPDRPAGRLRRLVRGRPQDPAWIRPAIAAVLVATGVLTTWALDVNGCGNTYYASAALAGSDSWSAWFYGALDAAGFITVDKPPLSIWVTSLSIRAFGLSSWSVLLPQAVAGVVTTYVLFRTVRRWHGPTAGVGAAAALAVTPVAVVIFRYNNPDAVLTLLVVGALALGYGAVRSGSRWQLIGAFALVGLGFLTKTTQALLVIPAIAGTYLIASPRALRRRVADLALSLVAMVLVAGWWIAVVELVPEDARPYIGGTTGNSFLEYVFGYNGLGRIFGQTGPAGDADPFGGGAGWTRLFNDEVGGQVSWLLIPAFAGLAAGLWRSRRRPWSDGRRAGYVLWGTALVVHALAFSFAHGVFHPYYTVTMAPIVAALAGAGLVELWRLAADGRPWPLAATVAAAGWWATILLGRTPEFAPWLRTAVAVATVGSAVAILVIGSIERPALAAAVAALGIAAVLAGPAAYAIDTLGTSYAGGDPKAGPADGRPNPPALAAPGGPQDADAVPQQPPGDARVLPRPGPPPDGRPIDRPPPPGAARPGAPAGSARPPGGNPGGPAPDLGNGLTDYLIEHRHSETWLAAASNAHVSAPLMLETQEPVLTAGGFGGGDPALTVDDLAAYVAGGELRFVVATDGARVGPGGNDRGLARWVEDRCDVVDPAAYGGSPRSAVTLYDCAGAA